MYPRCGFSATAPGQDEGTLVVRTQVEGRDFGEKDGRDDAEGGLGF